MSENDEQRAIDKLVRINLRTVECQAGFAKRGPHTKHHGCVSAIFRVRADIPENLRHGLFGKAGEFPALIRFSNAIREDDRAVDIHGMAIKVLEVPGTKLLSGREEERAQDFLLIDTETLPTGGRFAYELMNRLQRELGWFVNMTSLLLLALFHLPVVLRLRKARTKDLSSPLETSYFSTTPYAFGPHRVKYVARPREPGRRAGVDSPEGLADALARTLAHGGAVFEFGVDIQTDPLAQPIEDPSVNWSEAGARREWLAEIVIPRQTVDRAAPLAENLTFAPWHALQEHEPLGYINRARRQVYGKMQCYRHQRNRIAPLASSEAPPSYEHLPPPVFGDLYWAPPPEKRGLIARLLKPLSTWAVRAFERWPWVVRLVEKLPWLRRIVNRLLVNRLASMTAQRPLPLSLWTPGDNPVKAGDAHSFGTYVAWPSLVDRSFTGRHLPPIDEAEVAALPPSDQVKALFKREELCGKEVFRPSLRSSAMFCFFAQWLSDSFLRTHPEDRRRNTSNHELDLCQVYGLGQESTRMLRTGQHGRLASRDTAVGELPPFLADPVSLEVRDEFANICFDPTLAASFDRLDPPHGRAHNLHRRLKENVGEWAVAPERWSRHYVGGLERANSTILYSAFNTLFLREHNRLAGKLFKYYRASDDDWLFETARNINIVKYLKILIEDYLSHLNHIPFKICVEPGFADACKWYRANRISLEFNLVYRWHSLIPEGLWIEDDAFPCNARLLDHQEYRYNNELIERYGIETIFDSASRQPCGRVGMHNTPHFLLGAEKGSIELARQFRLAPFNAYRRRWKLAPYRDFMEMTGNDEVLAKELACLYPDRGDVRGVDRVELAVGLYAETRRKNAELPTLLSHMVASDAFSHALTNPLLAAYVFGEGALTDFGMGELERVGTLADIVKDNCAPGREPPLASFTLCRPGQ